MVVSTQLLSQERIVRMSQVKDITGLSKSSVYKYMADGDFPRQRQLGPNSVGWLYSEIMEWLESRQTAGAGGVIRTGLMLDCLFGRASFEAAVYQ